TRFEECVHSSPLVDRTPSAIHRCSAHWPPTLRGTATESEACSRIGVAIPADRLQRREPRRSSATSAHASLARIPRLLAFAKELLVGHRHDIRMLRLRMTKV